MLQPSIAADLTQSNHENIELEQIFVIQREAWR